MAEEADEMPVIVFQPDKMFSSWKATIKVCVLIVLCCALYGYLHIYIRTLLMRNKRLEQIGIMVMETEKMMQNLYILDQDMSMDLEDLNEFYPDY